MTHQGNIFLVDDDLGALKSLRWLMEQAEYNVFSFSSGKQFLESLRGDERGCVVLDLRMPELDGLEIQQQLLQRGSTLPVIFLTGYGDVSACSHAFRARACDFLEKPVDDQVLLASIAKALAMATQPDVPDICDAINARFETLTPRERGVFDLMIQGKTLKQIALQLGVSVQTVWRHRNGVFRKMMAENEVELVRMAMRTAKKPQ